MVIIRFWSVARVVKFIKGKWNGLRPPLTNLPPLTLVELSEDDPTPQAGLTTGEFWRWITCLIQVRKAKIQFFIEINQNKSYNHSIIVNKLQ